MKTDRDPTRDEMLAYLAETMPYADEWTTEPAVYWFAAEYHGGQSSNLYKALCASPYQPGMLERACPGDSARDAYDLLVEAWGGVYEPADEFGSCRTSTREI